MRHREYIVSYSMHIEAESPQEAAEMLADYLGDPKVPFRGVYTVEDEDGREQNVDLGEQRGEW